MATLNPIDGYQVLTTSTADETDTAPQRGRTVRRFMGYVRGLVDHGLDCERPVWNLVSRDGGPFTDPEYLPCGTSRASQCGSCARRYRRRVNTLAKEGIAPTSLSPRLLRGAGGFRTGGFFYFLTLTAPGDGLHCLVKGCHRAPHCRHEICRCTGAEGTDMARWNPTLGKRWNRFLTSVERYYHGRPQYFWGNEVQPERLAATGVGALHKHAILWSPAKWSKSQIRRLAIDAGFGHSVDLEELTAGSKKAAHYVAKYVSKTSDERDTITWGVDEVDWETYEVTTRPAVATCRTWGQSRRWGTTVKTIKQVNRRKWEHKQNIARLDEADGLVLDVGQSP